MTGQPAAKLHAAPFYDRPPVLKESRIMMTFSKSNLAILALVAGAYMPLQAGAALFSDDEARRAVLDLRNKVNGIASELNARIDAKADRTDALAQMNQHEQTMREIARLRGQIEVLANDVAIGEKRQKDFYADLDGRLRKLEPRMINIDGNDAAVAASEQSAYDVALATFKAGDYKGAATALDDFVKRYPASAYAANAQYWLGNAHYAMRDCKSAISAQQVVVKTYPDSPKAADAMLNMASCYTELKDKNNAKKMLDTLVSKYPDSSAAQLAKERLGRK
ncbi:MAG: tol-pal system protein YbgF [Janthinobacterium sp.]|jgi:tol-pal system protein YbgF